MQVVDTRKDDDGGAEGVAGGLGRWCATRRREIAMSRDRPSFRSNMIGHNRNLFTIVDVVALGKLAVPLPSLIAADAACRLDLPVRGMELPLPRYRHWSRSAFGAQGE